MSKKLEGAVIIPSNTNVWEHEMKTAQALADTGNMVQFISKNDGLRIKSPDIMINGVIFEMKSPKSDKLSAVERNLKRAYHQSVNIVFDSRRMKRLSDRAIEKELVKQCSLTKKIKRLLFVNRKGKVAEIK